MPDDDRPPDRPPTFGDALLSALKLRQDRAAGEVPPFREALGRALEARYGSPAEGDNDEEGDE